MDRNYVNDISFCRRITVFSEAFIVPGCKNKKALLKPDVLVAVLNIASAGSHGK